MYRYFLTRIMGEKEAEHSVEKTWRLVLPYQYLPIVLHCFGNAPSKYSFCSNS